MSANQRRIVRNDINGHRRLLEVVRLDDKESRAYGKAVADTLKGARFSVRMTDFGHTSPATGVIVCQNSAADVKLFGVLKEADIATEQRRSTPDVDRDRPAECPDSFAYTSPGAARIFVGQRK